MRGLALEGGGAKGAYEIGAYKALIDNGYTFRMVTGTSIGAVNAALIAQGDFKLLHHLWQELDSRVFNMEPSTVASLVNHELNPRVLKSYCREIWCIVKNRGISLDNFKKLLNEYIDEDKIRRSRIKFGLVTFRLHDFTPLELSIDEIPHGKLVDYILASCSLPVFKLERLIDERYYLDGAFTNVVPITLLERFGVDEVIAVRVKKFGIIKKKQNRKTKVTVIEPSSNIGSMVLVDQKRSQENYNRGYYDALKTIKKLDGDKYCFKRRTYAFYEDLTNNIDESLKNKMLKKYHVNNQKDLIIKLLEELMLNENMSLYDVYSPTRILKYFQTKLIVKKDIETYTYIKKLKSY